jgi:hypothetical protein
MKGQDVLPLGPALWAVRNLLVREAFERIGHSYELVWSIILIRNWYKLHLRKFGIKWRWKGKGGGLESLEDAIKRLMDEGYYILNIGLLRLRTGYAGVFDSG